MPARPLPLRVGWTLRDYALRVWDNSGEDNVLFLASGIAFNILLAVVPFILLLVTGLAYFLNFSATASSAEVSVFIDRLLPTQLEPADGPLHRILDEIVATRGQVGLWSAVLFIWFTTRLFGSLRSVLCEVFDIDQDRGIIEGKWFDVKITVVATILFVAYTALSTYLAIATSQWVPVLTGYGLRDEVMGQLELRFGQLLAFAAIALMFYALYKYLPNRRIRWQTALIAAIFTSAMIEIAKHLFTTFVQEFRPGTIYTGTLYAIVIVVMWVYYAAIIFIIGGEVAQVHELRRVKRLQRESFDVGG